MIRILEGLPDNVLGVEAAGKVTDDDYEKVLIPASGNSETRTRRSGSSTCSARISTAGAWARLGGREARPEGPEGLGKDRHRQRLGLGEARVKALGWMVPGEVRVFDLDELDAAKAWAAS